MSSWERSACYPRSTFYPLSDGPSTRNHRITMPDFRPCSTRWSRSQAPLCHYTLLAVTNRHEGTFGSLRYAFGGDHPSQTTHHTMSPVPGIRPQASKGTYFKDGSTSPGETRFIASVLSYTSLTQNQRGSCSKGSRGLSVPLRVRGIFTATTISPSSWLRQYPDRYTIRAGRNLPDKEFRYLRTVYSYGRRLPGLQFKPSPKISSPLNLPAPGRCQALYIISRFSKALCFC